MNRLSVAIATALLFTIAGWAQSTDSTQSTTTTHSTTQSTTTPDTNSAQSTNSEGSSSATNSAAGQTTIKGCLSGSAGTYVLTESKTGTAYTLDGDDTQLAKNVSHEIAVTGVAVSPKESENSSASSSSSSAQPSSNPQARPLHLRVSSVQELADNCANNHPTPK